MSVEHNERTEPRRDKFGTKFGWIEREGGSRVRCNLIDVSESGARLKTAVSLGSKFVLSLTEDGKVARLCKVIWQKGSETGVLFVAKRQPNSPRV